MSKILCTFAPDLKRKESNMYATANTQGVYLNVPRADWTLLQELINRFGWQSETREDLLAEFLQTRPTVTDITEEDIMDEVRAVRYGE